MWHAAWMDLNDDTVRYQPTEAKTSCSFILSLLGTRRSPRGAFRGTSIGGMNPDLELSDSHSTWT
jgi:hypothetical protein